MLVNVPGRIFGCVFVLDHQPFAALFAAFQLDENKTAAQLLSVQAEFDFAFLELLSCVEVALGGKRSAVPNHYGSGSVAAFGNFAFEAAVLQRMVFGLDREAFVSGVERRTLRHCPGLQGAIDGQPEVVVKASGRMLL